MTPNPMTPNPITRKHLRALGASDYLAKRLTRDLAPTGRVGRANIYAPATVLSSIQNLQHNQRIKPTTRQVLAQLETALQKTQIPADDPLAAAMAKVAEANARFEATAQQARKVSQEFDTYRRQRGKDFKPSNNVVSFSI